MPEMEVEVAFEVICECGNGLCGQTRTSTRRGMPQVIVDPCEKCLERRSKKVIKKGVTKNDTTSQL